MGSILRLIFWGEWFFYGENKKQMVTAPVETYKVFSTKYIFSFSFPSKRSIAWCVDSGPGTRLPFFIVKFSLQGFRGASKFRVHSRSSFPIAKLFEPPSSSTSFVRLRNEDIVYSDGGVPSKLVRVTTRDIRNFDWNGGTRWWWFDFSHWIVLLDFELSRQSRFRQREKNVEMGGDSYQTFRITKVPNCRLYRRRV